MRVSFVEDVSRNADGTSGSAIVSEWNEGKSINEKCAVTDLFGKLGATRSIPVDSIAKV